MSKLAVRGGKPVLGAPPPLYNAMGPAEIAAAERVVRSGVLSGFVGAWGPDFHGGPEVRALEDEWARRFGVAKAVTMNSATSGLIAAMGAIGLSPGDEVILPPYTMSATAMAPLFYGGIPVFADVEPDTFCISPESVKACLTEKTRAIFAVNLFGHPAQLAALRKLADERGIWLVEDNAQGPLAREGARWAGTVGHIGVFSLNYHKHFHTGEGGVCVTDDAMLARKLGMIRNHGENVVEPLEMDDLTNMVGHNFRLGETAAAIGRVQLARSEEHVQLRERVAAKFTEVARDLEGITPPAVRAGCRHVYYVWAFKVDEKKLGVSRNVFAKALAAEGLPVAEGYVRPLYRLPLFRKRRAFGRDGWPFTLTDRTYPDGLCPVVERLHEKELMYVPVCSHDLGSNTVDRMLEALVKVHRHRAELRGL
jgi:perosamine synthetase